MLMKLSLHDTDPQKIASWGRLIFTRHGLFLFSTFQGGLSLYDLWEPEVDTAFKLVRSEQLNIEDCCIVVTVQV